MSDGRPGRLPGVGTRLLLGYLALVVLMTVVLLFTLQRQAALQRSFEFLDGLHRIDQLMLECRRQEKNFLLRIDQASLDLQDDSLNELVESTGRLRAVTDDPDFSPLLERLHGKEVEYGQTFKDAAARVLRSHSAAGEGAPDSELTRRGRECHALLDHMRGVATERLASAIRLGGWLGLASVAGALLIGIALSVTLTRGLARQLRVLRDATHAASLGNLRGMGVEFEDLRLDRFDSRETFDLAASVRRMITSLRLLVPGEPGSMDDFHMKILLLATKAAGPGARTLLDLAAISSGLDGFDELGPATLEPFLEALDRESTGLLPAEAARALIDAIRVA